MKINISKSSLNISEIRVTIFRVLAGAAGGGAGSFGYVLLLVSDNKYAEAVSALLYSIIGGAIGGIVGITLMSSTLLGIALAPYFRGPYFIGNSRELDLESYVSLILLVGTTVIALRCLVVLTRRIAGFDLLKETLMRTIVVTALGVSLFYILHYLFLPSVWDKFILNVTS